MVVLAASSTTDVMEQIATSGASLDPPVDIEVVVAGSPSLIAQLESGVEADVLITANRATMDRAIATGRLTNPPTLIATNTLALAVASGNNAGVTRIDDLADSSLVIGACSPDVPCGALALAAADAEGITIAADTEELSVRALATKIQLGEVDAGLVYRTDANALMLDTIAVPGLDQHLNEYLVALIGDHPNEGARALVELLIGPTGHAILSDLGFEPA